MNYFHRLSPYPSKKNIVITIIIDTDTQPINTNGPRKTTAQEIFIIPIILNMLKASIIPDIYPNKNGRISSLTLYIFILYPIYRDHIFNRTHIIIFTSSTKDKITGKCWICSTKINSRLNINLIDRNSLQ